MAWIKRNLIFVISAAVGLALTGYCAFLLYSTLNHNAAVRGDYEQKLSNLKQLQSRPLSPSPENIQAATNDQQRIRMFLTDFRKEFVPFPLPPAKSEQGFKKYLEDTLVQYRAGATNAGVQLPDNYSFSFSGLTGQLNYPPANIAPWMQELEEIGVILDILYRSKINYLAGLQRVPVAPDDTGPDCLATTTVSNQWGSVTPYRIVFRGFSSEIASVLAGFAQSPNCFIVKSILVIPDTTVQISQTQSGAPPPANRFIPQLRAPAPAPNPTHFDRGVPGIPGLRQPIPAPVVSAPGLQGPASGAASGPPVTILSERPLLVTVSVDVVKLKASEP